MAGSPSQDLEATAEAIAAASIELAPASTNAVERADFAAVQRAIGNARIVLVGEPWHGDGGAIALRGRLVQYLHEHANFDVLAYEADFYSVHEGWSDARRTGDLAEVRGQIYPFWSQSGVAAPLWKYIAETMRRGDTLHVAGIDPKMAGPLSRERLPGALAERLARLPGVSRSEADGVAASLIAGLSPTPVQSPALSDSAFQAMDVLLSRLERSVTVRSNTYGGLVPKRQLSPDDLFWGQVANGVRRNIAGEQRDIGMGANLLWLALRQYPGHKIIVLAHNNHIAGDKWMVYDSPDSLRASGGRPTPDSVRARTTLFGAEARRSFGARLFVLGTTDYDGSYSPDIEPALSNLSLTGSREGRFRVANFDSIATLTPAPAGTLESAFARTGRGVTFTDLRPFLGHGLVSTRILDYTKLGPVRVDLPRAYDGVLFLRHTFGLNQTGGAP